MNEQMNVISTRKGGNQSYTEKSLEDRSMKTLAKLVKEEEEGIHT